jgi:hypothetical protein
MTSSLALVVLGFATALCLGVVGILFMVSKADVDYEEAKENMEHRLAREAEKPMSPEAQAYWDRRD